MHRCFLHFTTQDMKRITDTKGMVSKYNNKTANKMKIKEMRILETDHSFCAATKIMMRILWIIYVL